MSLREKASILKKYFKNLKKSISFADKINICIIFAIFILLISPVVYSLFSKISAGIRQKDIFVTSNFEELFGKETTETILQNFMKENPDIKIKLINTSSDKEKGREPDIFILDENDGGHSQAKALAVPLVSFMDLLFYNIELLKAAGFDRPPKSREEFLYYAKNVSKEGKASGAAMSLSPKDKQAVSRDIFSWIWASGGDFWPKAETVEKSETTAAPEQQSQEPHEPQAQGPIINTKALVRDIAFLGSLYRDEALAPLVFDTTGDKRLEEFAQGKIAMMIASTRVIPYLREKMGDAAFSVTVIPGSGLGINYNIGLSGIFAGLNAESEYTEEARSFLNFLMEQSPLLCAELKAVPGMVSDLFSDDYLKDDTFYSKARSIFESSQVIQGFSKTGAAKNYEDTVREELKISFESERSAEETAATIQRRWELIKEQ